MNASPDLRAQIESFPALHPSAIRGSPIRDVILTNADLDHVLGLFLLREEVRLHIHSTSAVARTLIHDLHLEPVLRAFTNVICYPLLAGGAPLRDIPGNPTGLSLNTIELPGVPPPYVRSVQEESRGHSVALQFTDDATGRRLLVAPDVAEITPELRAAVMESDAVLMDGTFWSETELRKLRPGARNATEMGHVPISGEGGTLALMRAAPARLKAYVHINNTNPILMPGSRERVEVEDAGVTVPEDGWEFEL